MYKLTFFDKALKHLERIPKHHQIRIIKAMEGLKEFPFLGKKLQGEYFGLYSLRVWPYRIIYRLAHKRREIEILEIRHRQGIY